MRLKTRIRFIALCGVCMLLSLALRSPVGNVIFATFGGAFCWMLRK